MGLQHGFPPIHWPCFKKSQKELTSWSTVSLNSEREATRPPQAFGIGIVTPCPWEGQPLWNSKSLSQDCHPWPLGTTHPESFSGKVSIYTTSKDQPARSSNLGLASFSFYDLEKPYSLKQDKIAMRLWWWVKEASRKACLNQNKPWINAITVITNMGHTICTLLN